MVERRQNQDIFLWEIGKLDVLTLHKNSTKLKNITKQNILYVPKPDCSVGDRKYILFFRELSTAWKSSPFPFSKKPIKVWTQSVVRIKMCKGL